MRYDIVGWGRAIFSLILMRCLFAEVPLKKEYVGKRMNKVKNFFQSWKSILFLLLIGTLSYGIYLSWMGFYWDDWTWIWLSHVMGPKGMLSIDALHRPLSGAILYFGSVLFGQAPFGWQVYSFVFRILGAISFHWFLLKMWPQNKKEVRLVSILFLLYPGFSQQFVSVNISRHLFPLITFFLSLGWMVKANKDQNGYGFSTIVSLVFSLITALSTEYYYGLELIRPFILGTIYYERSENISPFLRNILKRWLPYLIPVLGIYIWRFTVSERSINYPIIIFDKLTASPLKTTLTLLKNIITDIVQTGLFAWLKIFQLSDQTLHHPEPTVYYGLLSLVTTIAIGFYMVVVSNSDKKGILDQKRAITITVGFALFNCASLTLADNIVPKELVRGYPFPIMALLFCLWGGGLLLSGTFFTQDSSPYAGENSWNREAIFLAAAALILAPIPFWVTYLNPKLTFPADRLTLPMMFGSSLLVTSGIKALSKRRLTRILVFASIIGLAMGFHNKNAYSYRNDWNYQKEFFKQLTTRIPGIKPNTAVLSHQLRGTRSSDFTLTAPLNWIYAQRYRFGNIPYSLFYIDLRFGKDPISLTEDSSITRNFLSDDFNSSARDTLVIYYNPPSCLRVLDQHLGHKYITFPYLPEVKQALPLSNPERVLLYPKLPKNLNHPLYEAPVSKDWCYYFEKAALARQRGKWEEITQIGDMVLSQLNAPHDPSEYIPYIEGYAHIDQWARAESLTYEAMDMDEDVTPMLCHAWNRIVRNTQPSQDKDIHKGRIYDRLGGCK